MAFRLGHGDLGLSRGGAGFLEPVAGQLEGDGAVLHPLRQRLPRSRRGLGRFTFPATGDLLPQPGGVPIPEIGERLGQLDPRRGRLVGLALVELLVPLEQLLVAVGRPVLAGRDRSRVVLADARFERAVLRLQLGALGLTGLGRRLPLLPRFLLRGGLPTEITSTEIPAGVDHGVGDALRAVDDIPGDVLRTVCQITQEPHDTSPVAQADPTRSSARSAQLGDSPAPPARSIEPAGNQLRRLRSTTAKTSLNPLLEGPADRRPRRARRSLRHPATR